MILKIFSKKNCPECIKEIPKFMNIISDTREHIKIKVHSINTDSVEGLAEAVYYGILKVPTFMLFKSEEEYTIWFECPDKEEFIKIYKELK